VLVTARKIGELGVPGELPEPAVVATMPDLPASAGDDPSLSLVAGEGEVVSLPIPEQDPDEQA